MPSDVITPKSRLPLRWAASIGIAAAGLLTGDAFSQHVAITVLGSPAVRGAITELAQRFEAETGYRVVANYDVFAVLKRRIDAGEAFDMVILSPELIDELVASGTVAHDTRLDLGRHGVGLGAREGLTLPDIQNVEAFRRSVLAAESIAYFKEGTAGAHFRSVISRLGIANELQGTLRAYDAAGIEAALRARSVQYVAAGVATLRALPGVGAVAALPDDVQSYTTYTAAVARSALSLVAARAFLRHLSSSSARGVLAAHGLEPVAQ